MTGERIKEKFVYDKIMNYVDDFIKHGERTDLSGVVSCVAYIQKGKFTKWLKDNFNIYDKENIDNAHLAEIRVLEEVLSMVKNWSFHSCLSHENACASIENMINELKAGQ